MQSNTSNQNKSEETIKVLSLRIYKRIIEETHLSPIRLEPNIYNDKLVVWIFPFDDRIKKIIDEEKQRRIQGGK